MITTKYIIKCICIKNNNFYCTQYGIEATEYNIEDSRPDEIDNNFINNFKYDNFKDAYEAFEAAKIDNNFINNSNLIGIELIRLTSFFLITSDYFDESICYCEYKEESIQDKEKELLFKYIK